jgi:hypothetical protein
VPTFNEDVTVNGAVTVNRRGDGAVLLNLLSERSWEFRQLRSGQDSALELVNIGGGGNKSLIISTTGQIGIGTQSPEATLDLNASRNPQLPASFPGMRITRQGNGAVLLHLSTERPWEFRQRGSGAGTALELANVGPGGNKNFIINTTGKVGIGTTTPEHTLDVNGSIRVANDVILAGADCAEEFDIDTDAILEPGTVMVIGPERRLQHCSQPYDRRVVGIISGTGDRRPGIVLGRSRSPSEKVRVPLALTGTVWCNVDATTASVEVGDLLTTSSRPGHAMRASDASRSFGAVVGKAMEGLASGLGSIPVFATLH